MNSNVVAFRVFASWALVLFSISTAWASTENTDAASTDLINNSGNGLKNWRLEKTFPTLPQQQNQIANYIHKPNCLRITAADEIVVCAVKDNLRFRIHKSLTGFNAFPIKPSTQAAMVAAKCDHTGRQGCHTPLPISSVAMTLAKVGKELITDGEWRDALLPMNDDMARYQHHLKEKSED